MVFRGTDRSRAFQIHLIIGNTLCCARQSPYIMQRTQDRYRVFGRSGEIKEETAQ